MLPVHHYASAPLTISATLAHDRLRNDMVRLVESTTADAIAGMAPFVRTWGLAPTALPDITVRGTARDELGSVEVSWSGAEDDIAWPALVGRLLITPRPSGWSRLSLVSIRSPAAQLRTVRIGAVHRRRLVGFGVQWFVRHLADHLDDPGPGHRAAGVTRSDPTPLFVHHLRTGDHDPDVVLATLMDAPEALAARITEQVVSRVRAPLAAGNFRREPDPQVHVRVIGSNELGALIVGWTSHEEATGWPQLQLCIGVEATAHGSRIMVLSAREPVYDLSLNRVDKAQRHLILRELGAHVVDVVRLELPPIIGRSSEALPGDTLRFSEVSV